MLISFHTFGCKTNYYDTKEIYNKLSSIFTLKENEIKANVHVINTCTVTNSADAQARNLIKKINKNNKKSLIIICGCSVRNNDYSDFIKKLSKDSSDNYFHIIDNLKEDVCSFISSFFAFNKKDLFNKTNINNLKTRTRAFLKISDGCNNYCSYCVIPYVRGRLVSRKIQDLVNEAISLEKQDYKELVITGICVDAYEYGLHHLIESILTSTKNIRIRLSSIRPSSVDSNLINLFLEQRLRPHFHISLQSGSDKVLKDMNRFDYTGDDFIKITNEINFKLEKRNPFIASDVIVGFPSEGEEDFKKTYEVLNKSNFTNLHVFKYSPRKRTKAYKDYKVIKNSNLLKERSLALINLAKEKYQKQLISNVGREIELLWESDSKAITENYFPVKGEGKKNLIELRKIKDIKNNFLIV